MSVVCSDALAAAIFLPFMHPNPAAERHLRLWLVALFCAYFLYLNWDRVTMHFAADEMMNISAYFIQVRGG